MVGINVYNKQLCVHHSSEQLTLFVMVNNFDILKL